MKPKGSGFYAVAVGFLFIGGAVATFFVPYDKRLFLWLLRLWLAFVAFTLMYWGMNRIKTGSNDLTVGQDTINMVNGVLASTIALLALMFGK